MRSLRARLILGFSLVAVVPLAIAMSLLSNRVETMVRTQADERLTAALGGLEAELRSEGARIDEKLTLLSGDPLLKRLYLLRPGGSRDLSEYLAERRLLLGLDFLQVADTSGAVVAEGSVALSPSAGALPAPPRVDLEEPLAASPGTPRVERLRGAAGMALAARAPIRYENRPAGTLQGGLRIDAAFLARLQRTGGMELIVRDPAGHIQAATSGPTAATGATAPVAGSRPGSSAGETERVTLRGESYFGKNHPLEIGAPPHGSITGLIPTAPADRTIGTLRITSTLLGILGLGIAVFLGILWSAQVSRPVERLAEFSRRLAQGDWDEPLTLESVRELETLVDALDRMRRDLVTYREKLITSERQAAWSQMARKMAHEIKNPLTPIAVSVADLKRSYDLERTDFPQILDQAVRTIGEEVAALKRLLQEFAEYARLPAPRPGPCRVSDLLAGLETLYGRESAEGHLTVTHPARDVILSVDAGQITQALVNLIKNGLEAVDGAGSVALSAASNGRELELTVADTGPGLTDEQRANLFVPGFTTKAEGSGLGLTIVERIVTEHKGTISVDRGEDRGTIFRIRLPVEAEA